MHWYTYLESFSAGVLLTNFVPHFVQGISGNRFPTPFADPPGKGLSSPTVNVLWALLNLVPGYLLFRVGMLRGADVLCTVVFFAGIAFISITSSLHFAKKHGG